MSFKVDDLFESVKTLNKDEKRELVSSLVDNAKIPICDADELQDARKTIFELREENTSLKKNIDSFEKVLLEIRNNGWVQQLYVDVMKDCFVVGVIMTSRAGVGSIDCECQSQSAVFAATALLEKITRSK